MVRPERILLGDALLQQGVLTDEQLKAALVEQRHSGRKLGHIFIESGYVTEEALARALASQLQAPFLDLKSFEPKPELIRLLPEGYARRFRALVLGERDDALLVGFADPTDLQAYDDIGRIVRRPIDLAVVMESQLLTLFDSVYSRVEEISDLAEELNEDLGDMPIEFGNLAGLSAGAEDAPVVRLLHTVFEEAMKSRASDIHIEPQEQSLIIRFRIDGVLRVQIESQLNIATALVLRLKLISELDISEKRLPQDGRFNVKVRNDSLDVRISTMPTQYGESVVMRLLNQSGGILGLDRMQMPANVLARLRHAINRPSGMVLVTGPTGSGKTTTLYAALSELSTPEKKVITVEDPVEYRLAGINQVQVNPKIGLSFERVLRSALRQDPDIILVGEMRDQQTAEIGLRAALTGHMVLSTLHTNDALSTPIRLLDMGVPRYMVALSLQMVLAQRLVRTICGNCSGSFAPLPHEEEWLRYELGDEVKVHSYRRGRGCAYCGNTGYYGRQGVYEILEMSQALVEVANRGNPQDFMEVGRQQMAGNTLRRDAVRLVVEGRTTIEEAMRISNQFDD